MSYYLQMARVCCFARVGVAILVYRIRLVGFMSGIGGVALGWFDLVHGELSPVYLLEVFSKKMIFI